MKTKEQIKQEKIQREKEMDKTALAIFTTLRKLITHKHEKK